MDNRVLQSDWIIAKYKALNMCILQYAHVHHFDSRQIALLMGGTTT